MSKRESEVNTDHITNIYDSKSKQVSICELFGIRSVMAPLLATLRAGETSVKYFFSLFKACLIVIPVLFVSACGTGDGDQEKDPVVVDQPIAFIKRPLTDAEGERLVSDLRQPGLFRPGAALYLKTSAAPGATSRDISSVAFSDPAFLNDDGELLYDVRDLHVSSDATKLLFSMRAPEIENADEEDQPKWNIWEYDLEASSLRRIISSNISAEEGNDISPVYLPDGRILFSSTRQRLTRALLLNDGKPQYSGLDEDLRTEAFNLHVMDANGESIQQLTFNHSHDLSPEVLDNGKILFSRWDNAGQTAQNGFNLYEINPDGSGLNYLYGRHSHDSGATGRQVHFVYPLQLENDNIAVQLREFSNDNLLVQPTEININDYVEHNVVLDGTVLDLSIETGGQESIVKGLEPSQSQTLLGSYSAFFPLNDGSQRYLVSWSVCRVQLIDADAVTDGDQTGPAEFCTQAKLDDTENYEATDPLYGLWLYDAINNTQLPIDISETGVVFDEAVLVKNRQRADEFIPSVLTTEQQSAANDNLGIVHIRSVYDFDGVDTSASGISVLADPNQTAPEDRPQRFVRIEKPVSIPDDTVYDFDNTAYGRSRAQLMREVLGYAPVEPDGSVKVAVPANVPFAISILNAQGKRTSQRHQNWLQVAPGETLSCIGCHTGNSEVPHGRRDAQPESINTGAMTTGNPFPNTDPALFANMGETMAETYARVRGLRTLSPDILFEDVWTDPAASPSASFSYAYSDLQTLAPINRSACEEAWNTRSEWDSICRIIINYTEHIHPLWSLDRREFDVDEVTLLNDYTCTACHTSVDENQLARVPDAQLDLTDGPSAEEADHLKSYRELLFNDNELELIEGILVDRLIETGEVNLVPQLDEEGVQEVDENGEPIFIEVPVLTTVNVPASMSVNGALSSSRFLSRFETGGSHQGYLTTAELKLLAEWLDLGAQYYNDPFKAPAN